MSHAVIDSPYAVRSVRSSLKDQARITHVPVLFVKRRRRAPFAFLGLIAHWVRARLRRFLGVDHLENRIKSLEADLSRLMETHTEHPSYEYQGLALQTHMSSNPSRTGRKHQP